MLKVDYVLSVKIKGRSSGKEKASAEKIKYLARLTSLHCYTLDRFRASEKFKNLKMLLLDIYYLGELIFARKIKPDLLFARSNFHFGPFLASKLFKIPLINEVHGDILDEGRTLFKDSKLKRGLGVVWHYYWLFFLKRSGGLIFNNPLLEKHYRERYLHRAARTITVHNGTDPEFFQPLEKREARRRLGLREDIFYLLFIGSISRWHGVENILETFYCLDRLKGEKEIKLLIVGGYNEGYLQELQKKYYHKHIDFRGEAPKEEALYYINAADLCLLPVNNIRISPGSPLKLFDYAACGKPVVTQEATVGYSDLVETYRLGISCDFTNYNQAATDILAFLETYDPEQYRDNNRRIAEDHFSWEKVLAQWIAFGLSLKNDRNQ